jgi:hypothetical protein
VLSPSDTAYPLLKESPAEYLPGDFGVQVALQETQPLVFDFVAPSSGKSVTGSEIGPLIDLGWIGGISHGFAQ